MWCGAVDRLNAQQIHHAETAIARRVLNLPEHACLTCNDVGWTSRVYLYRQGYAVVKFPRYAAVKQEYAVECALYRHLQNCVFPSVQLPRLWAVGLNYDYMAYTGIVGETVDLGLERHVFDASQKRDLGQRLGLFLKAFHGLSFANGREETPQQEIDVLQEKYRLGLPYLKKHLQDAELQRLEKHVTQVFVEKIQTLGYERVFCHGDLGLWNMVYRQKSKALELGIIDFGDVCYGDASRDFVGLSDPIIRDAALEVYGETPQLRERVLFRQKMLPILELPYYLGKHNQVAIEQPLLRIRALL